MPRRDPADPRALFAPLVQNLAQQGKPLVKGRISFGRGGVRFQTPEQMEQEQAIELLREKARLESGLQREKVALDPEVQARQEALSLIREITPLPEARLSPMASPQQRDRLQELFRGRMTNRLEERARLGEMFGLAPRRPLTFESLLPTSEGGQPTPQGFDITRITRGGVTAELPIEEQARRKAEVARQTDLAKREAQRTQEVKLFAPVSKRLDQLLTKLSAPSAQAIGGVSRPFRTFTAEKLLGEPTLNEFLTTVKAVAGQLAKTVSRESGRLTDQDIQRVIEVMLQMPFLPESARQERKLTINTLLASRDVPPLFPNVGETAVSGRVRVRSPQGQIGTIPASQLEQALQQGFRQVE